MLIDKTKGCIRSFISSKVFLHTKDVSEISLRRSFQSNGIGLTPDRGCNRAGFEGSVLAAAAAKAEGTGMTRSASSSMSGDFRQLLTRNTTAIHTPPLFFLTVDMAMFVDRDIARMQVREIWGRQKFAEQKVLNDW